MANSLSVDNLYELKDEEVKRTVIATFLAQLENAGPVKKVFFEHERPPALGPQNGEFVENVVSALVASAISRSSLYDFNRTVDQGRADSYWQQALRSDTATRAGQALYEWAFPEYCRGGGHTFREYLNDRPESWGQQFATYVSTNPFVNVTMNKLISGEANWLERLNLVLYKIHRLHSPSLPAVLSVWQHAYPDKGVVQMWQSYNYVPAPAFHNDEFMGQVATAINVREIASSYDEFGTTYYVYGGAVWRFLSGRPKALGLTTGQHPNNIRYPSIKGFVAGTPVQLADGRRVPIESVKQGDVVLARDGATGTRSDESVVARLASDTIIYGINDDEPFFGPGRLFWTDEGWKALEPAIGREENPSRQIGKLQEGDVVFRLVQHEPPCYEQVKIQCFSRRVLPAGALLYGLHLEEARSYHAHGFCVGMNYPVITEQRLSAGLSKLSHEERRFLARQLKPALPLLAKAIGNFIEGPLQRTLGEL
ncbi:MAG TPA: hypothetical protein VFB60_02915 [Ktedonobacteraceae bacterium]|nr:hypothetical protein [Ktedonobacteraceae bacterium]